MAGLSPFGGPFSSMIMGERVPSLNPTASLPPEMVRLEVFPGVWIDQFRPNLAGCKPEKLGFGAVRCEWKNCEPKIFSQIL